MPPQDQQMQTAPDPRAELDRLRKVKRLRELEAKASGQTAAPALTSDRSAPPIDYGQVANLDPNAMKGWYSGAENRDGFGAQIPSWKNRPAPIDPLAPKGPPKPAPKPPALWEAPVNVAQALDSDLDKGMHNLFGTNMQSVGRGRTVDPTQAPISEQAKSSEAYWNAEKPPEPMTNNVKRGARKLTNVLSETVNMGLEAFDYGRGALEPGPRIPMLDVPEAQNAEQAVADGIGTIGGLALPLTGPAKTVQAGGQLLRGTGILGRTVAALTPQGTSALAKGARLAGRTVAMVPEAAATAFGAGAILGGENMGGDGDRFKSGVEFAADPINYIAQPAALFLNRAAIFIKTAGQRVTPEVVQVQRAEEVLRRANATPAEQAKAKQVIDQLTPPAEPPKPFSAPAEPAGGGIVSRNADRFIGGAVGATIGGVGDAYAAPGDGSDGGGGPLNATTGAFLGAFGPRTIASVTSRGFRAAARPIRPKGFDERVAARAVRNALKAGGIRTQEEAAAAFTARFGDKPASIADLTQEGVSTAAGLSRRSGVTGEAARARGEDLLANRAGRLERDIADTTGANPATIAGDVDRMVTLARQQATPAYAALREQNPFGSFASSRLEQLRDLDILRSHLQGADRFRDTIAATEGRVVGDFEYWDLVKRSLDDAEQSAIARNQAVPYDLDSARQAIVREVDALVPEYAAARQLGGEAPRMQEAFRQGQGLLGGRYTAEDVTRLAQGITGQQLTALQAGVIRSMVQKTEGPRGAMAALMAPGARQKLTQVFGPEAADAMQARFAADAAIVNNAQRINPNVGSVTSQAQMGEGGILPMAAEAIRVFRSPVEATLAAMSKGGAYSKAQRDLMGQMLLDGATPENLARIYGNRGGRRGGNVPPAPAGPPPTGGGPRPTNDPNPAPAAPANTFNVGPRPQPSPEDVAQAQGQLRAAREASLPERDRIGAWQGEVPQKPQSLLGWIRSQGGINDRNYMSGDTRAIMGRANAMPGLINRQSGQGLDDIVAAAYHQGFDVDPDDANSLMRLIEEEVAGNPSYRIGAREEWDVYQEYLASRRGDLPGQTSQSSPVIGGALAGGALSGGATYAATGDEDLAMRAGLVGAIGGGVAGAKFGGGKPPKAPPAAPAFDQRFMKEAQRLVSYNGGVDQALKAQQYVIDQLKNSKAPNAQDRINRAVSVQNAIRRMAERSNRELDQIVPMAEAAPTGPKPIDPNTNYNIDPRGDKFVIRTDAGEEVLGAPEFTDRKQALAWLQGETRKARQGGANPPRSGPPGVKPPPVRNGFGGNRTAIGAATGTALGMATAPDQNGDGVVDAQERMLGGAGGAISGGIVGNAMRRGAPKPPPRGPVSQGFGGKPSAPKGPSLPPRLAADLNKSKVSPATRATLDQNAALPPGERKSVMEATGWSDDILRIAAPYIRPGTRMESEVGNRIARLVQQANANPVEYALRQTMAKGAYEEAQKRFKQASGARGRAERNLEKLRSRNMLNPNQPATQQQLTVHKQRRDDAEQFLSEAARLRDEAKVMLDRADVELMSLPQVRDFANKEIQRITDALGVGGKASPGTAQLPSYNPMVKGPKPIPKPGAVNRPSKQAADELAHLLFEQDMAEKFAKIQSGEITPTQRNTFQQVMSWYARHPSLAAVSVVAAGGSAVGYAALATDQGERAVQARENARKRSGQPEPELPGPPAWDWEKLSRNRRFVEDAQAGLQALGYKIGRVDGSMRRADGKPTETEKAMRHFLWTLDNTRDPEAPPTEAEHEAFKEAVLQARRKR